MVDAGVVVNELPLVGQVATVEGAVAVLAALKDVQVVAEPMGAGRGGPHFQLAGGGLPELVVPDVVGGTELVLDDLQPEVGVFAEVGGDGPIVQTIGTSVRGGPDDDLGVGLFPQHDQMLWLGHMGSSTEVVVDEDGLVEGGSVGNQHGAAVLGSGGLQGGKPFRAGKVIGLQGSEAIRTVDHGLRQGTEEDSAGVERSSASKLTVHEDQSVGFQLGQHRRSGGRSCRSGCQRQLLDAGDPGVLPPFIPRGGIAEALQGGQGRCPASRGQVEVACGAGGLHDPFRQGCRRGEGHVVHACWASAPTIQS